MEWNGVTETRNKQVQVELGEGNRESQAVLESRPPPFGRYDNRRLSYLNLKKFLKSHLKPCSLKVQGNYFSHKNEKQKY